MQAIGCIFLVENGGSATTNPIGIGHAVQSNNVKGGERTKSPLSLDLSIPSLPPFKTLSPIVLQLTRTTSRFWGGIVENTSQANSRKAVKDTRDGQ
ncbi:hypothetical protein PGTUg99_025409 [Puccinia graminis f. sp. tritici]|uniref:Uncharacterized protein n=1 Tax=Puccinia graminis f. sp. tritici TaxID=56615 RepID=A0A5B0QL90_PUCGR|nr:hypothetical protein PGTUg99_025409 [Puccinia graminis f. sp. tritici]